MKAPKAQALPTVVNDHVEKLDGSHDGMVGLVSQSTQIGAARIQRIATSDEDKDVHVRHRLPNIAKASYASSTETVIVNFITQRSTNEERVRTNSVVSLDHEQARALRDQLNAMDLD